MFGKKRKGLIGRLKKDVDQEAIIEEAKLEAYRQALEENGIEDIGKIIVPTRKGKEIWGVLSGIDKRKLYDLENFLKDQNISKGEGYRLIAEYSPEGEKIQTKVSLYAPESVIEECKQEEIKRQQEEMEILNKAYLDKDPKAIKNREQRQELDKKYDKILEEYAHRIKAPLEREQINATRDVTVPGAVGEKTDIGIEPSDS